MSVFVWWGVLEYRSGGVGLLWCVVFVRVVHVDMHVWRVGVVVDALSVADLELSRDRARAVLLGRLEQVWATVAPHVDGTVVADGFRPDPRLVAVGVQVLDRLWRLWRLDEVGVGVERGVVDVGGVVLERLLEVEGRG